jgi:hypothetical protein
MARLKDNGGSGLPYCWTTPEGRPIYVLRIELRDDGVVVRDIDPRARPDDHARELLDSVPRNETISISALLSAVSPLQMQAVSVRRSGIRRDRAHEQTGLQVAHGPSLVCLHGPRSRPTNERSIRLDEARERLERALADLRIAVGHRLADREAARRGLALPRPEAVLTPEPRDVQESPRPAPLALPRSFIRRLWSGSWFTRAP